MPHIAVKWYKGRSEEEKKAFAEAILKTAVSVTGRGAEHFSVTIEDYEPENWIEEVYNPEIAGKEDKLYIRPGYGSLAEDK